MIKSHLRFGLLCSVVFSAIFLALIVVTGVASKLTATTIGTLVVAIAGLSAFIVFLQLTTLALLRRSPPGTSPRDMFFSSVIAVVLNVVAALAFAVLVEWVSPRVGIDPLRRHWELLLVIAVSSILTPAQRAWQLARYVAPKLAASERVLQATFARSRGHEGALLLTDRRIVFTAPGGAFEFPTTAIGAVTLFSRLGLQRGVDLDLGGTRKRFLMPDADRWLAALRQMHIQGT